MPHQRRVLIVDDDPAMTRALARDLASDRYETIASQSPIEALQILKQTLPEVIIADFQMPGMSGTQLLTHARVVVPQSGRILISGSPSLEMAMDAINLGAVSRLFIKPFSPTVLALAVRGELDRIELLRLTDQLLVKAEGLADDLSVLRGGRQAPAAPDASQAATHSDEYMPHEIEDILRRLRHAMRAAP